MKRLCVDYWVFKGWADVFKYWASDVLLQAKPWWLMITVITRRKFVRRSMRFERFGQIDDWCMCFNRIVTRALKHYFRSLLRFLSWLTRCYCLIFIQQASRQLMG